jgi:hypothetical protein
MPADRENLRALHGSFNDLIILLFHRYLRATNHLKDDEFPRSGVPAPNLAAFWDAGTMATVHLIAHIPADGRMSPRATTSIALPSTKSLSGEIMLDCIVFSA